MSESNPYAAPNVYESIPAHTETRDTTEEAQAAVLAVQEEEVESNVPVGSIKEVLAWVGDDQERALEALEAEEAGSQRKTLVGALEEILSA